jgi:hypothetical protein
VAPKAFPKNHTVSDGDAQLSFAFPGVFRFAGRAVGVLAFLVRIDADAAAREFVPCAGLDQSHGFGFR